VEDDIVEKPENINAVDKIRKAMKDKVLRSKEPLK
jgi:hypothetical protein